MKFTLHRRQKIRSVSIVTNCHIIKESALTEQLQSHFNTASSKPGSDLHSTRNSTGSPFQIGVMGAYLMYAICLKDVERGLQFGKPRNLDGQAGAPVSLTCHGGGCNVRMPSQNSFGPAFNSNGGGWVNTDNWEELSHFKRRPAALFNSAAGSCDLESKFKPNNIIINLNFLLGVIIYLYHYQEFEQNNWNYRYRVETPSEACAMHGDWTVVTGAFSFVNFWRRGCILLLTPSLSWKHQEPTDVEPSRGVRRQLQL
ncbi:hypothetical protein CC1G_02579 [Coprinopsis cinerea okayama7|uniref:Uncharacterized protein n=1 Tax=Coprinopsis cinerea (strain Okayama-7 / 130 / ATCC MYA-4618 / FGSC 9003) TaxID=240176 RepID=A8PB78_COPC7|nr:hypothetical protein CC1G_02579 [Coprinopsis cinerea okayama7\|eukprot:XP_001840116.2 hypothetical protein CC1G_02579 [Coprinopsis cinerea okayama7\